MSMIFPDECLELGLPKPFDGEKQKYYVIRLMLEGYRVNTRMCRYIGIGNLHSIVSELKKSQLMFSQEHLAVVCPKLKEFVRNPVDVIWMTQEQIDAYWAVKKKPVNEIGL